MPRWAALSERIFYFAADATKPESFTGLAEFLRKTDAQVGTPGNYLFYLSVAPSFFAPIVQNLGKCGLAKEENGRWRRVIIEKPFGHDLPSAVELNRSIKAVIGETQIFRIDHYLGKETVQNLMVFRFGNGMFEPIWNRNYIDHVQITVGEELGVEGRGPYYDTAGAMRDMVPNHIAQLLSLVGMEPPISFSADAVRDEQVKLLNSIDPLTPEQVLQQAVRGQYGPGEIDGKRVPGYREEEKVPPESNTETFVALRLMVDNWRWAGVPFYARTGKRLPKRMTQIVIQFKHAPAMLFQHTSVDRLTTNRLYIHIQPKEGISLRFGAKVPGPVLDHGRGGDGLRLRRLLREGPQHRLRDAALRRDDRRRDAVPARGHGGGGLVDGAAGPGRLEGAAGPELPELPGGELGPARGRRAAPP